MKFLIFTILIFIIGCGKTLSIAPPEKSDSSVDITIENDEDNNLDSGLVSNDANTDSGDAGVVNYIFERSNKSPSFFDDFERPNNSVIGNGWTEKTDAFSLVTGGVILDTLGAPVDRIVRRAGSSLNLEISGVITIASAYNENGLFLRMQPDEVGNLTGYRAWFATTKIQLELRTKTGNGTAMWEFGELSISPSLLVGKSYILVMRVTGDDTVTIEAGVFDSNGKHIKSIKGKDDGPNRIAFPGMVGFGHREANGNRWESFSMIEL
jgi:hypothetical protein